MTLYRRPECVIHEVNVTVDPDRCVKCGAVNRWTVPVEAVGSLAVTTEGTVVVSPVALPEGFYTIVKGGDE